MVGKSCSESGCQLQQLECEMLVSSAGIQEVESYTKYGWPTSYKPHSHLAVSAHRSISEVLPASQTVLATSWKVQIQTQDPVGEHFTLKPQ